MSTTKLGLVCLTSPSAAKMNSISYRTITRTSLEKLSHGDQITKLTEIYRDNALMLKKAIQYCAASQIYMYRMSSSAFPFADQDGYKRLLPDALLRDAGDTAKRLGVRLLSHPDQFCVLSSDKPHVIANSIQMLTLEAHVFDLIGLPQSHWAPINVHIGRKGTEAIQTILSVIPDLAPGIKNRLTLENDEFKQSADATIDVCQQTGVACLFDYHHELVSAKLPNYNCMDHFVTAAATTWSNPEWQVCHLSNGASGLHDKAHSEIITQRPTNLPAWLEIEAKAKEIAIKTFPW